MGSVAQPLDVGQVAPCRREQVLASVVLFFEHASYEAEPVRMDAGRPEADDDVALLHAGAVDDALAVHDANARTGEVDLLVPVDPRKLSRLAADERDARGSTHLRGSLHELRDLLEVDAVRSDVVEKDERIRAGGRDVVDAMRGEVRAARAQLPPLAGENELGPHRVRGSSEQPALVEWVEARESTEPCCSRRLGRGAEPFDDSLTGGERDARLRVRLPSARHDTECMRSTVTAVIAVSLLRSWTLDPLQLVPIAVIATAYGVRARTLALRGQPVAGWRIALFALGIVLLLVAVASPVAAVGEEELFSAHMAQHLLLGDLAPLCLLAGLTGPLIRPLLARRL
jgi:hypothetical protein